MNHDRNPDNKNKKTMLNDRKRKEGKEESAMEERKRKINQEPGPDASLNGLFLSNTTFFFPHRSFLFSFSFIHTSSLPRTTQPPSVVRLKKKHHF